MTHKTVLVLGALSAIGEATARRHAARGDRLVLVARQAERLSSLRADLVARGAAGCETAVLDLADEPDPEARLAELVPAGSRLDVAYLFYGAMGDQRQEEHDVAAAQRTLRINFTSAAGWCLAVANRIEAQDQGVLIAVSSVAGDRGRQSNYIYGAAKAGLTRFVEGIAHRLAAGGGRAVAVRLGFVDTPMTAHIVRKGPLWAKPETIAESLVRIADRPGRVLPYLPWFWMPIMLIVRAVPSAIFHRTRL